MSDKRAGERHESDPPERGGHESDERRRELDALADRYARRAGPDRYAAINPDAWQAMQERQRAMLRLFAQLGFDDLGALRLLEVGCGGGANLLELLRLGFAPEHLSGAELLPERIAQARRVLPGGVTLFEGDALQMAVAAASQDIAFASTVFSSLLDDAFQQRLADAMWGWVKPGGGVLWYDFTVNNPRNADVRGVPLDRLRALFPQAQLQYRRITLAPPIARAVTRMHPALYTWFNTIPALRTHVLAWIPKV